MASISEEIAKEQFDAVRNAALAIAKQVFKSLMKMPVMNVQQRQTELQRIQKLLDAFVKNLEKSQAKQKSSERPDARSKQSQPKPKQSAVKAPVQVRGSVLKKLEHSKQIVAQRDRDTARAPQKAIKAPSRDMVR